LILAQPMQPALTAVVLAEPPMVEFPKAVAAVAAVAPTLTAFLDAGIQVMMRPQDARELLEPRLLRVVEARVQRLAGIGDALERGAGLGHVVGALRQPVERCNRRLARILLARLTGRDALGAQLCHVTQGL